MQIKKALSLMLAAQLLAATSSILIKQLGTDTPVFQLLLYRQLIATLILLPLVWKLQGGLIPGAHQKLHLFRSFLIVIGNVAFMTALLHLPMITVTAVIYTSPIILVLLSASLLGEKLGRVRLIAVCTGFFGILMISRPGEVNAYVLLAFIGAVTIALNGICLKRIAHKEHPMVTLFWSNIYTMFFLIPAALWEGAPPTATVITTGLWLSLLYIGINYLVIHALRRADASQIAPVEYSGLVFAALFGYWFFSESIEPLTVTGIIVILLSAIVPVSRRNSPQSA